MTAKRMTLRQLQALEWIEFYAYTDTKINVTYRAYATKGAAGITSHHYKKGSRPASVNYWVFGRRAVNFVEALRLYNQRQREICANSAEAAISPADNV